MKNTRLLTVLALAALLSACGNDTPPATESGGSTTAAPAAPATPPAEPAAPAAAPAGEPVAAAGAIDGQKVYNNVCALCHAAGVAGAPMPGNKDDWSPRIAQGNDMLYKHAIEGFTGQKGMMPARGGNASLTDDEVKAAVDFMVQKSS
ncbi:MAG: cytochrome c5 family protein [Gammaproteobacteria bacterium]|nr:cytochrome c5 family protein [Gammaproteobacteria bacterium]